jgi:hypothetical protein
MAAVPITISNIPEATSGTIGEILLTDSNGGGGIGDTLADLLFLKYQIS